MATRYEYYITGDDSFVPIYGGFWGNWAAQTFTPAIPHRISYVRLELCRPFGLLPGLITVGIRNVDPATGHPIGSDLCTGTLDGDSITQLNTGLYYKITLGNGANLPLPTKYAIVTRALDAGDPNWLKWRCDASSPTYAGGNVEQSSDEGVTWTTLTTEDFMFEEWGNPLVGPFPTHFRV